MERWACDDGSGFSARRSAFSVTRMKLYCAALVQAETTPLFSARARIVHEAHHIKVWLVEPPLTLLALAELLECEQLVSACFLRNPPRRGSEYLFYEWHGRLLVDLSLVESVVGNATGWQMEGTATNLDLQAVEWMIFGIFR